MKKTHHSYRLATIEATTYEDGKTLYSLEYTEDGGIVSSSGMYDELELITELLILMGVMKSTRLYTKPYMPIVSTENQSPKEA